LSIAAYLRGRRVDFRIFGKPLSTWRDQMPRGMYLKSEGFASNLYDPDDAFPLRRFCAEKGIRYGENDVPVSLETFLAYAAEFQRRFVPNVEEVIVAGLDARDDGFVVRLANGETVRANSVIIAVGVSHAAYMPPELSGLSTDLLTHSSRHHDLSRFAGRTVAVIGAGQSALETATLLHEAGAEVRLIARKQTLKWNALPLPENRPLLHRLRRPISMLGPGIGPWLYCNAPGMFRYLPTEVRLRRAFQTLGPSGGWWLKERFDGRVMTDLGCRIQAVEANGRVTLSLQSADGASRRVTADHVIAATGYKFTLLSLPFLSVDLRNRVRATDERPVLSTNFESSVRGLYFTGLAATQQFGPVMRFLAGAGYTASRIARHVSGGRRQGKVWARQESLGHESGPREPHDPLRRDAAVDPRGSGAKGVTASRYGG
jgi:thioredoxin reductase